VTSKTALDYLKRGSRVGWCNYTTEDSILRNQSKPIVAIDLNSNATYRFDSAKICTDELSRLYNIPMRYDGILRARLNDRPYKGFKFIYTNNTQQNDLKEVFVNG
jgi:hypothetical protein